MAKGDDIQEKLMEPINECIRLHKGCDELCRIISASVKTAKRRRKNNQ